MRFFKRKLAPKLQTAYNATYNTEMAKIKKAHADARLSAVRAKARAAAGRDAQSGGSKALGAAMSIGKVLNKRLEKFDPDKFEQFVTGVGKKKKK